jgi:hypothetical protein
MLLKHECGSNKEVYDVKQVDNSVPTWRNLFYYGKSWVGKSSNISDCKSENALP